jgi:hypothetical protein
VSAAAAFSAQVRVLGRHGGRASVSMMAWRPGRVRRCAGPMYRWRSFWPACLMRGGTYHYRYASGHEGDSALASFSPRSQHLAIYLVGEFENRHQSVLARLGPHKTGKGCLYIRRLDQVDQDALRELIDRSVRVRKGIDRASG